MISYINEDNTIKTVLFKAGKNISCHTVGINKCDKIVSKQLPLKGDFPCYTYTAVYEDNKEVQISNVILATDQKLS